ncbi:MAG: DUF4372 domain-containing protein [Saprospiraceae bacterium]|nr:DUF4372 domain-containing protein [Saprospiraceae bacterium]
MKVSLFAQIIALIERNVFHKRVSQHESDKHNKGIYTWTHL